jgi:two-component system chemotaxis response regulator CheY
MIALVVDDSAAMRHLERKALQNAGWEVHLAVDGADALERLAALPKCDLIVTDYHMPKLDGIALIQAIRRDRRLSGVRILMITSDGVMDSIQRALDAGANDFMMKPFAAEALQERVAEVMSA